MITGEYWRIHDDATIRKIETAAYSLLVKGGVRIVHDPLLDIMSGAGCRIDRTAMRCFLSEKLITNTLAAVGRTPDMRADFKGGWDPKWHLRQGGSQPHFLDWPGNTRRMATSRDVIDMARMGHVLDEIEVVAKPLTCSDIDQRIEPVWAMLQIAKTTDKPLGSTELMTAAVIEPLIRMGEILTGKTNEDCLVSTCDAFIQPLILDTPQSQCLMEKRRFGIPIVPATMPIAGISAPITLAGAASVALAEVIAGWVIGHVLDPVAPVGAIIASGMIDMRTMTPCFGTPEAMLCNVSVTNLIRRLYGIHTWACTTYVDAKTPGLQATFQKMCALLTVPLCGGAAIGTDGLLSAGQDYSPVQQILDGEMQKGIERFYGQYDVTDETLGTDHIIAMMGGESTNFLTTDHTMFNWQGEQWCPKWLDRTLWRGEETEATAELEMLKRIDAYCKDAIKRYEPPQMDGAKIAELEGIYREAEKKLVG